MSSDWSIIQTLFQSTLLMRGATYSGNLAAVRKEFQSTLLMRGATQCWCHSLSPPRFQSTLLMRGATDGLREVESRVLISIHAPHARSDIMRAGFSRMRSIFQSTLLMRGATALDKIQFYLDQFQSTLLMRGATGSAACHGVKLEYFNPRSSCEERQSRSK